MLVNVFETVYDNRIAFNILSITSKIRFNKCDAVRINIETSIDVNNTCNVLYAV